jgi:hypothetical protein
VLLLVLLVLLRGFNRTIQQQHERSFFVSSSQL